jgi:DNA-binding transcriptional MerR regulator
MKGDITMSLPALLGGSEAARRLGVHHTTLHLWERTGKLLPTLRDSSGKRLYNAATIDRLTAERKAAKQ